MKTRIISALVGTVLLFGVLFCPWTWVFALVVAAAAAIAVWELLHNTGMVKNTVFSVISMLFAAATTLLSNYRMEVETTPNFTILEFFPFMWLFGLLGGYVLLTALVSLVWRTLSVWRGFALSLYATVGLASLVCLRSTPQSFGLMYVFLPLVIAWMSDTGAYFVGTFLGKHKMAPVISPKKSWEGFFGGWAISIGMTAVFVVICNAAYGVQLQIWPFVLMAALLAPLSVVGDLLASLIKRRCGIKDYGNIMPGHGGVMDRFDSVIFIAPMVLVALVLLENGGQRLF